MSGLRVLEFFRARDRGAFGWLSPQWEEVIGADPMLETAVVTVDLVLGQDTVVRLCTVPLEVVSSNSGEVIAYNPVLLEEPTIGRSFGFGNAAAQVESVTVRMASQLVKPRKIIAAGRMLAGFGEVCLQVAGGTYEQRMVLLRGEITGGVTFGADDETMEVEISDPKITSDQLVPPWVATVERHTDIPDEWVGERYPLVFNGYQKIEAIRLDTSVGWPSPYFPSWLACYGHNFSVTEVYVNGELKAAGSADYPWAELDSTDEEGTPYKEVAFSASPTAWEENDSVNITVEADTSRHLVDIISTLVEEFSVLGVDGAHQPLFAKARGALPDLRPEVIINASNAANEAGILSFIEGTLLRSFPMVSMVWQNGRYGPIVSDYRSKRPVAELEAGVYPLIQRVSDLQEVPKEQVFNSFILRYGWDALTETFTGISIRNPDNDLTCKLSHEIAGPRAMEAIESLFIQTSAEADYVVDWLVAHFSRPSYYLELKVFPWVFLFLTRGDSVWYTDPDFDWDAERAIVETISRGDGGEVTVGLRVWPGVRRLHAVGR